MTSSLSTWRLRRGDQQRPKRVETKNGNKESLEDYDHFSNLLSAMGSTQQLTLNINE